MSTNLFTDQSIREARYPLLTRSEKLAGIDYVKFVKADIINDKPPQLEVYFIPKVIAGPSIPQHLTSDNIHITEQASDSHGALLIKALVYPKEQQPNNLLIIELEPSQIIYPAYTYILEIVNVNREKNQIVVDSFFNRISFLPDDKIPAEFDCIANKTPSADIPPTLEIDYLAKDYLSFRQLMLNRLSVLMPQWQHDNPADITTVIIEALAYAADQLSYYQDAVATEAYLGTARQRISVKRHARLLDYRMHEGCNARVWVQIKVKEWEKDKKLPAKTTQLIARRASSQQNVTKASAIIFETMHAAELFSHHNELQIYGWQAKHFTLPKGTVHATLVEEIQDLVPGMVLIIEDQTSNKNIPPHAIRLIEVTHDHDLMNDQPITEIKWHAEDALPFDLVVNINEKQESSVTMSGNIVLADQGMSVYDEKLQPDSVPAQGNFQPVFRQRDLTFRVPFNPAAIAKKSASTTLYQNVHEAYAVDAELYSGHADDNEVWQIRSDLLNSNRSDEHFVIEVENDRHAVIRFGDGIYGKRPLPLAKFHANYRIGNGSQGNIGANAIVEILCDDEEIAKKIIEVRNPLPAQGGTDPESIDETRLYAPQMFKTQQRAITLQDYIAMIEQHPKVKKAAAIQRWTGYRNTIFIAADRYDRLSADADFKKELEQFLKPYQIIGQDVAIVSPQFVPLDISLDIHLLPGYVANVVKRSLLERFSNRVLPDGRLGFFHPDRFSFNDPVYLSQIIDVALAVPGVSWIDIESDNTWFRVLGLKSDIALEEGVIEVSGIQIAQVENDIAQPNKGVIKFHMEV